MEQTKHIYSVTELTRDIKLILENTFAEVAVEGEISDFQAAASGHFYFSLKESDALLQAAMFARANKGVSFKIENGLKVICFGKIDVYPPRGKYQLIVESIEPKGIGARQLAFEQLKSRLAKEGIFDAQRKKPLPLMPFTVGIVTSSAGAALRDILQILKKGAPCVDVVIRPVRVQGEGAAEEIAAAVEDFNRYKNVDVICISRGGGSTEDLWAFNEEIVARAVAGSKIPTISAVGHQINTTLSDLAADAFVETPSAAAKVIIDRKNDLLIGIDAHTYSLNVSISEKIHALNRELIAFQHMLKSPADRLLEKEQLLDELFASLNAHMRACLNIAAERSQSLFKRLEALSPLAVLSRGFSLTLSEPAGKILKDAAGVRPGDRIRTVLQKGRIVSTVQEVSEDERQAIF